jgi:hypothetical protein
MAESGNSGERSWGAVGKLHCNGCLCLRDVNSQDTMATNVN